MQSKRDYYEVLGIPRTASANELKKAYRKLAHKYHPDKNAGNKKAEALFKEASESYTVLSDPEKRAQYDRFGHIGVGNISSNDVSVNIQDIFGDIFSDFFGGERKKNKKRKGSDLRYDLEISFEEAAFGGEKNITINKKDICNICNGSGCKSGTIPNTCKTCQGYGEVRVSKGFFSMSQTCFNCKGNGQVINNPCKECYGTKLKNIQKKIKVKIPAGVDESTQLRFINEGESGLFGGTKGDLFVFLSIKKHPIFTRKRNNICCNIPISFTQATLGCKLEVPTLLGKVFMSIPKGTQTNTTFRLKNKGISYLRSNRVKGDQMVTVHVEIPKKLNKKQEKLLRNFSKTLDETSMPKGKSFLNTVKEIFG